MAKGKLDVAHPRRSHGAGEATSGGDGSASLDPLACSHRPPCPGCPRYGEAGLAPNTRQQVLAWRERLDIEDYAEVAGEPFAYRHRARLAVRGRATNPKFGLFEEGSHRVVDIPRCRIHHPAINEVTAWLKGHVRELQIPPYSEVHHAGLLRYVQLSVERGSGSVQLVLVGNCEGPKPLMSLLTHLQKHPHPKLHSLVFNGHPGRSNAIFGPNWVVVWGKDNLVDESAGVSVFYPPGAFSQANPALFDVLTGEIHSWVPTGAHLVELYCGVGAIGLPLVPRSRQVVFNEISPAGLEGLRLGLRALRAVHSSLPPIDVVLGDAEAAIGHVEAESTLIVDPPRKGLQPGLLTGLCERRPRQIVYVSCGFPALQRDAGVLLDAGYVVRRLRTFALFPFTNHVETVAEFTLPRRPAS